MQIHFLAVGLLLPARSLLATLIWITPFLFCLDPFERQLEYKLPRKIRVLQKKAP